MLGMPEIVGWYIRRFRQVFVESDLGRALSPFVQPIASTVLTVNWAGDNFAQPTNQLNDLLQQGQQTIADPNHTAAYLVTTADPTAIATAQYLWGSAQQVGLTIGGVLLNQSQAIADLVTDFAPLPVAPIPPQVVNDWQLLVDALPSFDGAQQAPRAITIDVPGRRVCLFLPKFAKKQVKLTQYGPEITIEAGDQRRNIFVPPELRGLPVAGAKFQDGFLIISF
jgi:arsenite-transporting ATPase